MATLPVAVPPKPLDPIPARMLNEFVYCPRLFYFEHVEGVFVESADTVRGAAIHHVQVRRVGEATWPVRGAANLIRSIGILNVASEPAAGHLRNRGDIIGTPLAGRLPDGEMPVVRFAGQAVLEYHQ